MLIFHGAIARAQTETAIIISQSIWHSYLPESTESKRRIGIAASIFLAREGEEGRELYLGKCFPQFWLKISAICLHPESLCSQYSLDAVLPILFHRNE